MRFDTVNFAYHEGKKIILKEADFSIRENTKITIMGQNGAGKSTIFGLITWELSPQIGKINITNGKTIAISKQVIPRDQTHLTIREYFETAFKEKDYKLDKKISEVMDAVNLKLPTDKVIKSLSGWQQARLLLAYALIQDPDILLLDEPTNNLDTDGINHLIWFLLWYEKTVVVISHDADFLNMFTDGVLYLNVFTNQVEQYRWDYYDAVDQIARQIEKEKTQNARAERQIQDAKDKINFFAHKWGKMRKLASKMRDTVEEAEDNKVAVRKDDKTISNFEIEFENLNGPIVTINNVSLMNPYTQETETKKLDLLIRKWNKYIIKWPNGIGKSTLLKRLINAHDSDAIIHDNVRVWYYSQDFDALDMNTTVWDALHEVSNEVTDQEVYKAASLFLLTWDILKNKIWSLSEWQKWLLCYARFVIQKPHLLILDEPTNHINFRHLPIIAEWLNTYKWAMIMVSHDDSFVDKIQDLEEINLSKLR